MDYLIYICVGTIIVFILIGLAIANFSGAQFEDYYRKELDESASLFKTAGEFAQIINQKYFYGRLRVEIDYNVFGGKYSPYRKTISLSPEVYSSGSVSALTVVSHELGHAFQQQQHSQVLEKNFKLHDMVKFLGFLLMPTIVIAIIMLFLEYYLLSAVFAGFTIISFFIAIGLKLSTIKLENEASQKAIELLEKEKAMSSEELENAKKLLSYAKQTYIGDFFKAILAWTLLTGKTKLF